MIRIINPDKERERQSRIKYFELRNTPGQHKRGQKSSAGTRAIKSIKIELGWKTK